MGMPVSEFLRRHSSRELTELMTLYSQEPFDGMRGDYQAALVASILANVNRDPKRRSRPYTVNDFLLFQPKKPRRTHADIMATMKEWHTVWSAGLA